MKNKINGFGRTFVSALVMLCMLFGIAAPTVMAAGSESQNGAVISESDKTINYVSIGDSIANGYGFTGYDQGSDDLDFFSGEGVYGNDAYPLQIEKWLTEQGYSVNHAKLAISAMRAEDFLYLLGERERPTDDWDDQASNYANCGTPEKLEQLKNYVTESVENADLITLGLGNASFGAYLLHRLTDALGIFGGALEGDEIVTFEDALIGLDDAEKAVVTEIYNMAMAELWNIIPEDVASQFNLETIANVISYTVAGFIINYTKCIETILALNPDATIVIVGLMNTTYGIEITMPGMDNISVGGMMDEFMKILNTYTVGAASAIKLIGRYDKAEILFAEQPEPKFICQMFKDVMDADWGVVDRLDGAIIRDRNIDSYNSDLRWLFSGAITAGLNGARAANGLPALDYSIDLPEIGLDEIEAFENGAAWSAHYFQSFLGTLGQQRPADEDLKTLSIAVYLGMEAAFAESADENDLPLDGLIKLATDMNSIFADVSLDLTLAPDVFADSITDTFVSNDALRGLCKVYALFKVGNGMSVHPTPAGHDQIAASVKAAIMENKTAYGYFSESMLGYAELLYSFVDPDIRAEISMVLAELAEIKAALEGHISEKAAELKAVIEELEQKLAEVYGFIDRVVAGVMEEFPDAAALVESVEELMAAVANGEYEKIPSILEEIKAEALIVAPEAMAAIGAAIEKIEAFIPDIDYIIAVIEAKIEAFGGMEAIGVAVIEAVRTLITDSDKITDAINTWVEELPAKLYEAVAALENTYIVVKAALKEMYTDAISASYKMNSGSSYYVALGDSTLAGAAGDSYADLLAEHLGVDFKDLSAVGNISNDLLNVIKSNSAEIAKADLITVGYSNVSAIEFAIKAFKGADTDWKDLFGDDVAKVADVIAREIKEALMEEINERYGFLIGSVAAAEIEETVSSAVRALEAYIYAYVSHIIKFPMALNEIRAASPEALIVIVGAYNELENIVIDAGDLKIELGKYFDYVTKALNAEALAYAFLNDNTVYVDAYEVETAIEADGSLEGSTDPMDHLAILLDPSLLLPTDAAHSYIFEQIIASLDVVKICIHKYDGACDADCNLCGEIRVPGAHTYGAWTVITDATAEAEGLKERKCTVCDEKQTAVIPVIVDASEDTEGDESDVDTGVIAAITVPSVLALGIGAFSVVWFGVKKQTFGALIKAIKSIFVRG